MIRNRKTERKQNPEGKVKSRKRFVNKRLLCILFSMLLVINCSLLSGCGGSGTGTAGSGSAAAGKTASGTEASGTSHMTTGAEKGSDGNGTFFRESGTYFNTVIDIKIYGDDAEAALDGCFAICDEMEEVLSAQLEGSELYRLNHRTEQTVEVSEDLAECIGRGLAFGEKSDGAFDITILPLRNLWNFEGEDPKVPDEEDIRAELAKVDYTKVHLTDRKVTFDSPETMIDLGGIAKGYISAKLKSYLTVQGITSALINLGGNVSTLGTKPDGSDWTVGIQKPFSDRGEVLTTVESANNSVISSGIYERYFEENGVLYHHILDTKTGYPVETNLNQVTIIGTDDADGDALATICVALGTDRAKKFLAEQYPDVKALFTDSENNTEWYPEED